MGDLNSTEELRVKLGSALVPSLLTLDINATLRFYQFLGFELNGSFPNQKKPRWVELCRDSIALQFYTEPPINSPVKPVCSGTFYCFPSCVISLAAEWQDKVDFAWGPEVMDYGMREFGIRDPNGYLLAFSEPADRA